MRKPSLIEVSFYALAHLFVILLSTEGVSLMAVANETIIQKMMQELNKAKAVSNNKNSMTKHIEHVKLLCELLLEEADGRLEKTTPKISKTKITAEEMKAMMGTTGSRVINTPSSEKTIIDHGEANGDSIFDF